MNNCDLRAESGDFKTKSIRIRLLLQVVQTYLSAADEKLLGDRSENA